MKVIEKSVDLIYDGFFKLADHIYDIQRSDGDWIKNVKRLNLERGDSVAVLLYNRETGTVLLTSQFRVGAFVREELEEFYEIPAGMIDPGESGIQAARREVLEELGYNADGFTFLGYHYPSPGMSSERVYLYYSEVENKDKVSSGGGIAGENEYIEIVEIGLREFFKMPIVDGKTLIARHWFEKYYDDNFRMP